MSNPTLTVIIPGHNTPETWWRRSVTSVLGAIGNDDEVICVDDGSSNRSICLDELRESDARVSIIYRDVSLGPSVARNDALKVARGKYVTFVDSDDEIVSDIYVRCIQDMETYLGDISVFGCDVIWPDDGLQKRDVPKFTKPHVAISEDVKSLYDDNLFNYVWNKIYRRDFLVSNGITFDPVAITGEDLMFNLSCFANNPVLCTVPVVGYKYFRTHGTLLSSYKRSLIAGFRAINRAWDDYKKNVSGDTSCLDTIGRYGDNELMYMEWRNIWMPKSPFSFRDKWRWLKKHPELGGMFVFIKMWIFVVLRRWLYFRPIRRWHIRRLFPHVKEV